MKYHIAAIEEEVVVRFCLEIQARDSSFPSVCPKKCNDLIQCALAPPLWGSDKNRYSYPEAGIRVDEATNVDVSLAGLSMVRLLVSCLWLAERQLSFPPWFQTNCFIVLPDGPTYVKEFTHSSVRTGSKRRRRKRPIGTRVFLYIKSFCCNAVRKW